MKRVYKKLVSFVMVFIFLITIFVPTMCITLAEDKKIHEVKLASQDLPRISGNFIQPWLFANWDEKRWENEMQMWKQTGIEYVIMGDVANKTKQGWQFFYDSNLDFSKDAYKDPCVDELMYYCNKYNIKVILGIGLNVNWYDYDLLTDDGVKGMTEWRKTSGKIMNELYSKYKTKYPETFYGWYWVEELYNDVVWNNDDKRALYAKNMAKMFNVTLDQIKSMPDSNMPLFFSPHVNPNETGKFAGYSCVDLKKVEDFWAQFINQTNFRPFDVLIPQSSVDHAACSIEKLDAWTKFYADAIKNSNKKIKFLSNVESFHGNDTNVVDITEKDHAYSRPLDVFKKQLDIVSKYCDTIFSFAYSHFYSPYVAISGYHNSYLYYLENGKLETNKPIGPNKIQTTAVEENGKKHLKLTFSGMWDDFGIGRINIYKNGKLVDYLVNKIGDGEQRSANNTWEDKNFNTAFSSAIYEIEVIDVTGNIGEKVPFAAYSKNIPNNVDLDENFVYTYNLENPLENAGKQPPEQFTVPIKDNMMFTKEDLEFKNIIIEQNYNDDILVSKDAFLASVSDDKDILINVLKDDSLVYSWKIDNAGVGKDVKNDFKHKVILEKEKVKSGEKLDKFVGANFKQFFDVEYSETPIASAFLSMKIDNNVYKKVCLYYCAENGEVEKVGKVYNVEDGYAKFFINKPGSYMIINDPDTKATLFDYVPLQIFIPCVILIIGAIVVLVYFILKRKKNKKVNVDITE